LQYIALFMKTSNTPRTTNSAGWRFDNSYVHLPETLFKRQKPIPVRAPRIVIINEPLAELLRLNVTMLADEYGTAIFAGNLIPEAAEPIAQAYAGHQFGGFAMLGDGRAILLGEHLTPDGARVDIQLKGSGKTPFSRSGDGRAAVGPMLREYIISEAMYALGIPTTRSLAVVATGEPVMRETLLPGAILTRTAASHIRVGTFEYVAASGDFTVLKALADYTITRHYPELTKGAGVYLAFLNAMMERQAALIAQWQYVGFIHGVMNTDNMAISGETIDYGPCAFMDHYDLATVFSSIDRHGRYAYGNQPQMAQWNIVRFAEALLPLLHPEQKQAIIIAEDAINRFPDRFKQHWLIGMRAKLGLFNEEAGDEKLINDLLQWMQDHRADYTNTFRSLSVDAEPTSNEIAFTKWHLHWQARLARQQVTRHEAYQQMRAHNPAIIPRNHRVEEALEAAVEREDLSVMHQLLEALRTPYDQHSDRAYYASPAPDGTPHYKTYCGT
jgi:uncharacterized protein YdiU (UPF0061 family)